MSVCARLSALVAMGVVVTAGMAAPARAQERLAATVTSVVDGDTVRAQLAGGPSLEVQLIGIDTPELDECGGVEATDHMKQLALGRNVTLVDDPTQPSVDQSGARCSTSTETTVWI